MRNKKKLLVLTSMSSVVFGLCFAFVPKATSTFSSSAEGQYTCDLPSSFYELDDVITECNNAGEEGIANTHLFRGTVTNIAGDVAFVQRVNQTSKYTYGLRVTGVETYAPDLQVGNVVDFNGGRLCTRDCIPTFELEHSGNYSIAFEVNPSGYGAKVFQNMDEFGDFVTTPYYDRKDTSTYNYAASVLVNLNNMVYANKTYVLSVGGVGYTFYGLDTVDKAGSIWIYSRENFDYYDLFNQSLIEKKSISVTGYYQCVEYELNSEYGMIGCIEIVNEEDVSLGNPYIDTTTISSYRGATFYDLSGNTRPFTIYNMIDDGDIPYVEFTDFYNNCAIMNNYVGNAFDVEKYNWGAHEGDEGCYIMYNNYFEILVDVENYIINPTFYDPYNYAYTDNFPVYIDNKPLETLVGVNQVHANYDLASSRSLGNHQQYQFELEKYGLRFVVDKNDLVYVPLQIMNGIFNDFLGLTCLYNGKDLYWSSSAYDYSEFTEESAWVESQIVSEEYAEYSYACLCFEIEEGYSLAARRGINIFDPENDINAKFIEMGVKDKLVSTDIREQEEGLVEFAGKWFCDAHSGYLEPNPSMLYLDGDSYWKTEYQGYLAYNDRYSHLMETLSENDDRRESAGKGIGVTYSGSTAIVTFDAFTYYSSDYQGNVDVSEYEYDELHEMGSELFFRKAFNEIENEHPEVDNVVFDLTMNGGGQLNTLPYLIAYMTSDPSVTTYNRFSGLTTEMHFDVDINFDGDVDSSDTYENDYDFYIMTSNFSFSCGNYFPTVCKDLGIAKIIGQTSGGGTCCVGSLSTAYGSLLRNSSCHFMGTWDENNECFVDNDDGVTPDYLMNPEYFYDDAYINTFVNNLKN